MEKIIQQPKSFRTSELGLAAALVCVGIPLDHLESVDNRRVGFVFLKREKLDKAIQDFWQGSLLVDAKKYFYALKEIKSRIYAEKEIV